MFFKYAPGEALDVPSPRPVYARVDQTEPVDDAGDARSLVLLDCIDADWLDENANRADHLSDPGFDEADRWISVIAISSDRLGGAAKDSDELAEWYRLELGDPDGGAVADQFHNLFRDPNERGVIDVRPVTPRESEMLGELAGWQSIEETPRPDIEEIMNRIAPVDAVAIYDVDQGAATVQRPLRLLDYGCGDGAFAEALLTAAGLPREALSLSLMEPVTELQDRCESRSGDGSDAFGIEVTAVAVESRRDEANPGGCAPAAGLNHPLPPRLGRRGAGSRAQAVTRSIRLAALSRFITAAFNVSSASTLRQVR